MYRFILRLLNEFTFYHVFGFVPEHAYGIRDKYCPTEIQKGAGLLVLKRLKKEFVDAADALGGVEIGLEGHCPERQYLLERSKQETFDKLFRATRLAVLFSVVSMDDVAEEVAEILDPETSMEE